MNLIDLDPAPAKRPDHDERTRQLVALRAASPLMGKAGQHDASDLALFRQADEPRLF